MEKILTALIPNRIMKKMVEVVVPGMALLFFLSISTAIGGSLDLTGGNLGAHDELLPPTGHDPLASHPAHWSFMTGAPAIGLVTNVNYFIHDHGPISVGNIDALSAGQIQNIQAAAAVWNTSGANVFLTEVFSDALDEIHVHGLSGPICGSATAIGCASFSYFTAHQGVYGDGDQHHQMASELIPGGVSELAMLTRSDWYTGVAGAIGGAQLDYTTVAIQEFGHLLGLGHNDVPAGHLEAPLSPMNGQLAFRE